MSYYVHFPTRNGESTLEKTLDSLLAQTVLPSKIIVIDDGSTDKTPNILRKYKNAFPDLFTIFTYTDKGTDFRKIVYFYNNVLDYVKTIGTFNYQLILADDVDLPSKYSEFLIHKMENDSKLVIASGSFVGRPCKAPLGAGRFIRESFFRTVINHYPISYAFESWILHEARYRGYKVHCFNNLCCNHLRPLGRRYKFRDWGKAMYCLGYHPLYALIRILLMNIFRYSELKIYTFLMFADYLLCRYRNDPFINRIDEDFCKKVYSEQQMMIKKAVLKIINRKKKNYDLHLEGK